MAEKNTHEFVPTHEKLDAKEAKAVLEKLNAKPDNLPKILSTDPQAVHLGTKAGDVIAIKRRERGTEYTVYRLVVEA